MAKPERTVLHSRIAVAALTLALLPALASCGGSGSGGHAANEGATPAGAAPPNGIVVRVGSHAITGAVYNHWLSIGEATVKEPPAHGPLPKPVAYDPPKFAACIARLQGADPKSTDLSLRVRCRKTYDSIKARILGFLITGWWLREQAAREGISVSANEVRKRFEQERRAHYPTKAAFRRLQKASRQTVPDLEFAVETRMLSERLYGRFRGAEPKGTPEQHVIAAFNRRLHRRWAPRTDCASGYVVNDCRHSRH